MSRSDQASKNQNRGMPGGREEFLFKKSFDLSYRNPRMQGVCGKSESFKDQAQKG
jgi:hypothetical protein